MRRILYMCVVLTACVPVDEREGLWEIRCMDNPADTAEWIRDRRSNIDPDFDYRTVHGQAVTAPVERCVIKDIS